MRVHLVRHGRAAAGWGEDTDPGLDDLGRGQAVAAATTLRADLAPQPVLSSPMRRAMETATPLANDWAQAVLVEPAFGEIPSPTSDLDLRTTWLRSALSSHWTDLDEGVQQWRGILLDAVRSVATDVVVFTHFVAINAIVAEATADSAVTVFLPANASITVIDVDPDTAALTVVRLGSEATPEVG